MRDRLIELLKEATFGVNVHTLADHLKKETIEAAAEYLLATGVIVPPCYIGQGIWCISKHFDGRIEIDKGKVSMLQQKADKSWKIRISVRSSVWDFTPNEIGKRYFFSKEEAEQAVKGGAE